MTGEATGTDVLDLVSQVRERVNEPRRHLALMRAPLYGQASSALDALGDTQMAIEAYPRLNPEDKGSIYLAVYGLLQVMFVQQDAARDLCEALGHPIGGFDPDLSHVREVRNATVGHPTKQDRPKSIPIRFNFIRSSPSRPATSS